MIDLFLKMLSQIIISFILLAGGILETNELTVERVAALIGLLLPT
jgi:hypothetical protein